MDGVDEGNTHYQFVTLILNILGNILYKDMRGLVLVVAKVVTIRSAM